MIVFDDVIGNKKVNLVVTESYTTCKRLNISLVFITQYYFAVPKDIRINSIHYFLLKIPIKLECQQITFSHSSDIDFKYIFNLYKKCTAKPYSVLVTNITLASDNPLHFR